jgi:hypothetical protein
VKHRAQCLVLAALFTALVAVGSAQEIASLDLAGVVPRLELRYPPGTPAACDKIATCSSGGFGSIAVGRGGVAPGELQVNLSYLDRSEYADGDEARIEVVLQNTGRIPLEIPWSPHLADLQPADESARFVIYELQVGLFLNWGGRYSTSVGWLNLYGDPMHPGTIVTMNSGESVRIRGTVQISLAHTGGIVLPAPEFAERASARTLFRKVGYLLRTGGMSEEIINTSPEQVAGANKPIHIFAF